jgi:hypothetical protein
MRALVLAAALAVSGSAHAQVFDPLEVAQVVGSLTACQLDIAEDRVEEWIRTTAPDFDLEWYVKLEASTKTVKESLPDLTPDELQAHCVRIGDLARALGFVE